MYNVTSNGTPPTSIFNNESLTLGDTEFRSGIVQIYWTKRQQGKLKFQPPIHPETN